MIDNVEIYLLCSSLFSIFLFSVTYIIMCYIPFKNEKNKYVINSIFCIIILFFIFSYIIYGSNLMMEVSSALIIGAISSILLTLSMFYDKLFDKHKKVNNKEIISIEDVIGLTGQIIHILDPEGDENVYIGKLDGNRIIMLFSIEKLEINNIFRVTEFKNGKFYCVLNEEKENNEKNNN